MGINLSRGAIGIAKRLPEEIVVAATAPIAPKKTPEKIRKSADSTQETNAVQFLSKSETKQIVDKFKPLPPVLRVALRDTQTLHREFEAIARLTQPPPTQPPLVQEQQAVDVSQRSNVAKAGIKTSESLSLSVRADTSVEKNAQIVKPPFAAPTISEILQPQVLKPSSFLDRVISALALNRPSENSAALRLGRQRVFEAFQRRVREGAVHDFAEQARQVVRSLEAHPLTRADSRAGVVIHQNVRFGGVASAQLIPDSVDSRINSSSFRIETVAQLPSRDDNSVRSQPVQGREKGSSVPEQQKGPKNQPLRGASGPPLLNLNPPQRPLPTNVRSRLVQVSSVNLLDLVL